VQAVTLDELHAHVWDRLPTLSRTVAGRRVVSRIVSSAVRGWPVPVLEQCDAEQTQVVAKYYTRTVERNARHEYGMGIILTLVLGALVQEIVKILVHWWLERQENRAAMRLLIREVRHHD
jgi:hypothetical protein